MSLKYFHIVFVTVTTLLSFGLAALEWHYYQLFGGLHYLGALLAGLFGLVVIVYGFWFWKKARRLII